MPLIFKPIILTFTAFYLPGYRGGGPIRTIANLVERLGVEFDFRIVTSDRDLGDQHPYSSVKVDAWNQVGQARVFYASPSSKSLWDFARLMRDTPHDILYLNSFLHPKFTLLPLLACKLRLVPRAQIVVAPRGELSKGAFELKRWKKAPFTRLANCMGLFDSALWQASSEFESADIQRVIGVGKSGVKLARNIAMSPDLLPRLPLLLDEDKTHPPPIDKVALRVCFLSRIAPMKNLDYALKVLAHVKVPIQFQIYGPRELSAYWEECEALIRQLPANVLVTYGGSIENAQVRSVIAKNDLLFVPTRGENFGHVFIEALSAGVPILVSDRTPWRDLKEQKIAWDIPLEQPDEFVRAVEEAAGFDAVKRAEMRARCAGFARDRAEDSVSVNMNRNLFLRATSLRNFSPLIKYK